MRLTILFENIYEIVYLKIFSSHIHNRQLNYSNAFDYKVESYC